MGDEFFGNLGPLAALAGVWEGDKGADVASWDDRGTEQNAYRERLMFEPFGPVNNHEHGCMASDIRRRPGDWAWMRRFTKTPVIGCGMSGETGGPLVSVLGA